MIIKDQYTKTMIELTKAIHPDAPYELIYEALEWSIEKRYKEEKAILHNNYRKIKDEKSLAAITQYILSKKPVITPYGVMFERPDSGVPNPLLNMIRSFMEMRDINKANMFKYQKGSEEFNHYYLLQILDKVDANGTYGVLSKESCLLYNIFVAGSITAQGRALIATATMFFESFLSNGVKFASLDEVLTFINNITSEKEQRKYKDSEILDRNITVEECFTKIVLSIGDFKHGSYKWYPDDEDLDIIWRVLNGLTQEDINRLYYVNNLYEFLDNTKMTNAIIYILELLKEPFLDPNKIPPEISAELEFLTDLLREYVMYKHHWIDVVDRCDNMIKNVTLISDTDSDIVCLETWREYITEKVKGIDLTILNQEVDELKYIEGDKDAVQEITYEKVLDYDFYNKEIIELEKAINKNKIIPQENLRYSIINIAGYILYTLANEYIESYTKRNFSHVEGRKCLLYLKNEFLFKVALLTNKKKNYATKVELQEGHQVPEEESLDIKGLPIKKSTLNARTRKELEAILYDEILNTDKIDQVQIIKRLAILEKTIYNSLNSGSKEFYKPLQIKSISNYADPMSQQGIKSSVLWNMVRGEGLPYIDLEGRNRIDVVKVNISRTNIERIKDSYPEIYANFIEAFEYFEGLELEKKKKKSENIKIIPTVEFKALAIPTDVNTPKWVLEFIDYNTIINDCICNFPIESVGITKMGNSNINYSNIISL